MMNVKTIKYIILTGLLFLAVSCVYNEVEINNGGGTDDGSVKLELFTNSNEFEKTKAGANEDELGTSPWVFVFKGTDENAVFLEAQQAVYVGGKTVVNLQPRAFACRILVIANTPDTYFDGTGDNAFGTFTKLTASTTFKDAVDNILTSKLLDDVGQQRVVPYIGTAIPMSGDCQLGLIATGVTIGTEANKLMLTRMLAKVTVSNNVTGATGNELSGATIVNAPRNGRFYNLASSTLKSSSLTDYLADAPNEVTDISSAATGVGTNNTDANPIYIYESPSTQNTSVIMKWKFNGTDYYYRLGFINSSGVAVNVVRNMQYVFKINSVTGPGYSKVSEAKAAPISNVVKYDISVTSLDGYDIIDNGQYYLAVSNSEVITYTEGSVGREMFKLVTNAPAGITPRSITSDNPDLVLTAGSISITGTQMSIKADIRSGLFSGNITIKLGNITKVIKVTRKPSIPLEGCSEAFTGVYVSGEVTLGQEWLQISGEATEFPGVAKIENAPGTIYMLADKNLSKYSRASGADVFLSRSNDQGRLRILAFQPELIVSSIKNTFVGTFHKHNETGERVIKIAPTAAIEGTWEATVLSGKDFIILDNNQATRTYPLDNNPEAWQVSGSATTVSGTCSVSGGTPIFFRIGMKNALPSAESQPRYGLVLLKYNTDGSPKNHLIYVRHGEAADYIMGPNETGTVGSNMDNRPDARKFTPYNLTDPMKQMSSAVIDRGVRGYSFTDYPSQIGYFFKWSRTRAWNPVGPVNSWTTYGSLSGFYKDNNWETCPPGYSRPNDGSITSYIPESDGNGSEMRQSIFLRPPFETLDSGGNSLWGHYADGFFDRGTITTVAGASNIGSVGSNAEIAYSGKLFYNPRTFSSLFLPAGGTRDSNAGDMITPSYSLYLTSTLKSDNAGNALSSVENVDYIMGRLTDIAGSIRCIKANEMVYSLTYDANGGLTVPNKQWGAKGNIITISPTPATHLTGEFKEWNTKQDGTGIAYAPNANYTIGSANVILYAQWKEVKQIPNGYVGTFHKYSEVGERVIKMPVNLSGDNKTTGAWTVTVIAGSDFIKIDAQLSGRAYPIATNPELVTVVADNSTLTGNCTGASTAIYFRVGMKSKLATAATQPRYGLIRLTYDGNRYIHFIYVRQGEAPDYLMAQDESANPLSTMPARPNASKISPFNLTDPLAATGVVDRGARSYVFTDYPSKSGYQFQWYSTKAWNPGAASATPWPQTYSDTYWDYDWEECPLGYKRFSDGSVTSAATTPLSSVSEMRQSLFVQPPTNQELSIESNSVAGYYADGYFDRNVINTTKNSVGTGSNLAYSGRVFYNARNNSSIFFPAAGSRAHQVGTLSGEGTDMYYWTNSSSGVGYGWTLRYYNTMSTVSMADASRDLGANIRCVVDDKAVYKLTYNLNGGTSNVTPDAIWRYGGTTINLSNTTPSREGAFFDGWNTQANGQGTNYLVGASYVMPNANVTLYAKWVVISPLENTYVGTFHKNSEKGERVIVMSPTVVAGGNIIGNWTATIVDGADFIKLDTKFGGRGYPITTNPEDASLDVDNNVKVTGNCTGSSAPIYFRVGLKSTQAAGAEPRYGRIELRYNNNTAVCYIYVRQGETADYLMRKTDKIATSDMNSSTRPLAKKFMVYNLTPTVKQSPTAGFYNGTSTSYTWTDYPSKAGYMFSRYLTRSMDPITTANSDILIGNSAIASNCGAWNTAWEVCPSGYRHPDNGPAAGTRDSGQKAYTGTNITANNSEIFQSLWVNPPQTNYTTWSSTSNFDNVCWGFYADGYFDRQTLTGSPSNWETPPTSGIYTNSSVMSSTVEVAYRGALFFNPYNNASLFFPAGGRRYRDYLETGSRKNLNQAGYRAIYWMRTPGFSSAGGMDMEIYMEPGNTAVRQCMINSSQAYTLNAVRCVPIVD